MRLYEEPSLRVDGPDLLDQEVIRMVPEGVGSLVDLGCGTGAVVNHFFARGLRTLGVDISRLALSKVQGRTVVADVAAVPVEERFDVVVLSRVLEHLDALTFRGCLREAGRLASRYIIVASPLRERLSLGQTRCVWCGRLFHASNHLRRVDPGAAARALAPAFQWKELRTVGRTVRHYPAVLWMLRTTVLGIWPRDIARPCPFCGSVQAVHAEREYHALSSAIDRQALRWRRRRVRATHFVLLLERKV
ncbi:MAG: class I SAM-dependent methyltransferase [Acetobacteraceae bacterium]|nr:class I SAM-dependent methyltransferase [Acetobacteraceae bacterium]